MKTTQQALRSVFYTDRLQTKQLQNTNSFGTGEAALLGRVEFRKERKKYIYIYIYIPVDYTRKKADRDKSNRLHTGSRS